MPERTNTSCLPWLLRKSGLLSNAESCESYVNHKKVNCVLYNNFNQQTLNIKEDGWKLVIYQSVNLHRSMSSLVSGGDYVMSEIQFSSHFSPHF